MVLPYPDGNLENVFMTILPGPQFTHSGSLSSPDLLFLSFSQWQLKMWEVSPPHPLGEPLPLVDLPAIRDHKSPE